MRNQSALFIAALHLVACGDRNRAVVDGGAADGPVLDDGSGGGDGGTQDGGTQPPVGAFCLEDGWCWQRPMLFGPNLYAVWGSAPADVWAVGEAGTMAHYDGMTWQLAQSGTYAGLYGLWGASDRDVWAVGRGGTLLHYDGSAWSSVTSPTAKDLHAIHGTSATDIYVVGAEDTRLHWNGTMWSVLPTVYPSAASKPSQYGVWAAPSGDVWSTGVPYQQSIPHRSGGTWSTVEVASLGSMSMTFKSVWGSSDNDVWMTGTPGVQGSLQRWDGVRWRNVFPPAAAMLTDPSSVTGSGPGDVWFFGEYGIGRWNGTQFVAQPALQHFTAGWVHPSGAGWTVGYGGRIAHKTTLEGGWDVVSGSPNGTYDSLASLAVLADDDAWAVGRLSIARWNGSSWQNVSPASTQYLQEFNGVWASASNDAWAIAWGDYSPDNLQHWNGTTWAPTPHPGPNYLNAIWGSAANDIWIAFADGNGGMHYDGTGWRTTRRGPGGNVKAMHGTAAADIWCVGWSGFISHFDGVAWTAKPSGTSVILYSVLAFSPTDAWAGGENGTLLRWNGVAWQPAAAPVISSGGDGKRTITAFTGTSSSDLWAATSSGEVFRFDGSTWSRSSRFSVGISALARTPAGAMFAAGRNGAVLRRAP